ncbi:MAG TPA: type II secretion system protein [Terracidiphilus sp.]|nr:type II secretion system protein [Terracidiphilus sp.]
MRSRIRSRHRSLSCGPARKKPGEEGILLVAVIFLLFLLTLTLAIALPKVRESIQRDRDRETMERGKQYIRAIQLYYRKFGRYPPSIDALVKTNEIRFLRKRYIDPTTGKDDWQVIHMGENKVPIVMGFFGQAVGQTTLAGTGPSGGNGVAGATTLGGPLNGTGTGGAGVTTGMGGINSGTGTSGIGTGSGGSSNGSAGGSSNDSFGSSNGQTFGGAGIIGVRPASPAKSIFLYKGKDHYNQWEFTYDPLMDRKTISSGSGAGGTPASNLNGNDASGTPGTTPPPTASPNPPSGIVPQ